MTKEELLEGVINYFKGDTLAAGVWLDKYALKDKNGDIKESTPDDMHRRLAKEFARIEANYYNPMSEVEIYNLLEGFKYVIPQGSPMAGIGNPYSITSLSNCFVIGSNNESDSYGSIMRTDEEQIQLMKRRGGVGHDISHLRPSGSMANNSVLSGMSGTTLYMERFSNSTREVSQGDRRGALMLSISVNHPDADKFIDMKMESGKVTGANISVKITDEFMKAVESDSDFWQTFPIDLKHGNLDEFNLPYNLTTEYWDENGNKSYIKKIKAKELWDKIIHNAHKSAEPGILFWDTIERESPAACYGKEWKEVSTNPCFTGDTNILTKDGYKPIKSLLWTNNSLHSKELRSIFINKNGEIVPGKVWSNGFKPVIQLNLSNGKYIECTSEHIFELCDGSECKAKNLIGEKLSHYFSSEQSYVVSIEDRGEVCEVFDFNLEVGVGSDEECHWGVIEGLIAHNCGEIPLNPYDSCRLLAINLYSYVDEPFTDEATFNWIKFKEHVIKAQRMMDDLVYLEIEKVEAIIKKIKSDPEPEDLKQVELKLWEKIKMKAVEGRRTGLGVTGEGDMLAAIGIQYASKEGIEFSTKVHREMAIQSYKSSIIMAKERGCFPIWDLQNEDQNPFINRILNDSFEAGMFNNYLKYGRRNIANLTAAPTGSVSILTQTSSGLEPCFQPFYLRRRKTNIKEKAVFTDEKGDMWEEYPVFHHKFKEWIKISGTLENTDNIEDTWGYLTKEQIDGIVKQSPYYKSTANDINWVDKVKMQGEIQKWIDHSISVTTNLPKNTTIETVNDIYVQAWKSGCKGHTIYRDGCRDGVLLTQNSKKEEEFNYIDALKRPKDVEVDIYRKTALKKDWMVVVGLIKGKPIEIFAIPDIENNLFPINISKGVLTKVKSKTYKLTGVSNGKDYVIENIINYMTQNEQVDTRKYSLMLRHKIHPKYIYNQIEEYAIINSFDKVVQRVLSKYLTDEDINSFKCQECGGELRNEGGCITCVDCGWSKCG